jgi:D-glycero-alpha-D-manno-heptose 1-phosphate guanylyltransferase
MMSGVVCIILAGGLGTRLRSVVEVPKSLAPVCGVPFLARQMASLQRRGIERFVLSLGHGSEQIASAAATWPQAGVMECVTEPMALGTGGAIAYVMKTLGLKEALVANGDTFVGGSLSGMLAPLNGALSESVRMACVNVPDRGRFGGVEVNTQQQVLRFLEKGAVGPGPINAGLYRLSDAVFADFDLATPSTFSFETAVLPQLATRQQLTGVHLAGPFIDIGVPLDYARFCEQHAQFE